MMPKAVEASQIRGRQQASLALLAHERIVSKSFGELLKRTAGELNGESDSIDAHCLARWNRDRARAVSVKPELVEQLSLTGAESFEAWRRARESSDFSVFEPFLTKMFALKREEAEQIGYEEHPYDAMIDEFEPGMTRATIKPLFEELRPHLIKGVELIKGSVRYDELLNGPLDQAFCVKGQAVLARQLSEAIGFPSANRLDTGTHPFCSAWSSHDVRLVTRYHADEVKTAIFATLHETGHGLYELHSPDELEYTPLRGGASLGVHESQSRLWENLVGRSAPFWRWAFPKVRDVFPEQAGGYGWQDFHHAVNRVTPSFIRVEADEITYSLHVILRFELESALLAKEIEAKDIPQLWNAKMKESLGVIVPNDAKGCLQDIHWSDGLIGYFPTYALGNLIASDLWETIERELPELQNQMSAGDFKPLLDWLIENLYSHASRYQPQELLKMVMGHGIQVAPFVRYLQGKYSDIYGVDWS